MEDIPVANSTPEVPSVPLSKAAKKKKRQKEKLQQAQSTQNPAQVASNPPNTLNPTPVNANGLGTTTNPNPADLITTANDLYRQIEMAAASALEGHSSFGMSTLGSGSSGMLSGFPAPPTANPQNSSGANSSGSQTNADDAYWASLPQHLRHFIRSALPLAAGLSPSGGPPSATSGPMPPLTHEQLSAAAAQLAQVVQSNWTQLGLGANPLDSRGRPTTTTTTNNTSPGNQNSNSTANINIGLGGNNFENFTMAMNGMAMAMGRVTLSHPVQSQHTGPHPGNRDYHIEETQLELEVDGEIYAEEHEDGYEGQFEFSHEVLRSGDVRIKSHKQQMNLESEDELNQDPGTNSTAGKKKKKKKKKKKTVNSNPGETTNAPPTKPPSIAPPPLPSTPTPAQPSQSLSTTIPPISAQSSPLSGGKSDRDSIRDFWLSLTESERKNLVKVEKDAVVKKMKDSTRVGCSCGVCGRKRQAIESELSNLYDAYYLELESYASDQIRAMSSEGNIPPPPGPGPFPGSVDPSISTTPAPKTQTQLRKVVKPSKDHKYRPVRKKPGVPSPTVTTNNNQHPGHHTEGKNHTHTASCPHHTEHPRGKGVPNAADADSEAYSDSEGDSENDSEGDSEDDVDGELDDQDSEEYEQDESEEERERSHSRRERGVLTGDDSFAAFGKSLTVRGGILTVADDLLANNGQKFLEMMEQLADLRIRRESDIAQYDPEAPHEKDVADEDDNASEEDEEDDDYLDDEDDDDDGHSDLSEAERMEEGRRMFQIFAARLFEQRVLTAFREKVASEKQNQLLRELEDEERLAEERGQKKLLENLKKKEKKKDQKAKKEEERLRKEAEKAATLQAEREAQSIKQEQDRQRAAEVRQRKEAEKRAKEEEKRLREERARQLREEERLKKEEKAKAVKEARLAAERELKERKAQEEAERKAKELAEKKEREEKEEQERHAREQAEREAELDKQRVAQAAARAKAAAAAARATSPKASMTGLSGMLPSHIPNPLNLSYQTSLPRQPSSAGLTTPSRSIQPPAFLQRPPANQPSSSTIAKHGALPSTPANTSTPLTSTPLSAASYHTPTSLPATSSPSAGFYQSLVSPIGSSTSGLLPQMTRREQSSSGSTGGFGSPSNSSAPNLTSLNTFTAGLNTSPSPSRPTLSGNSNSIPPIGLNRPSTPRTPSSPFAPIGSGPPPGLTNLNFAPPGLTGPSSIGLGPIGSSSSVRAGAIGPSRTSSASRSPQSSYASHSSQTRHLGSAALGGDDEIIDPKMYRNPAGNVGNIGVSSWGAPIPTPGLPASDLWGLPSAPPGLGNLSNGLNGVPASPLASTLGVNPLSAPINSGPPTSDQIRSRAKLEYINLARILGEARFGFGYQGLGGMYGMSMVPAADLFDRVNTGLAGVGDMEIAKSCVGEGNANNGGGTFVFRNIDNVLYASYEP